MRKETLPLLLLLLTMTAAGAWAQKTYTVKMKQGTTDAAKWTVTPPEAATTGVAEGTEVKLKYSGKLKVKAVAAEIVIDLSTVTAADLEADGLTLIVPNGGTLTGTLDVESKPYKIVIADGATVTLAGVTILGNNGDDEAYDHAGITCAGDATIILRDGTENTVRGFYGKYPGIYVPGDKADASNNKTLTIKGGPLGTGKLTANSNRIAAGIGGGYEISCGNIVIQGGDIKATGVNSGAGIGSGFQASCGDITISGGTVEATGGKGVAGIGSGYTNSGCGAITISGGTVKANGGEDGAGIGSGYSKSGCGAINITGGTVDATGGKYAAGIGSGYSESKCGAINITGGTVEATGGERGAGIGSGYSKSGCGVITITKNEVSVMATKGTNAPNSIGAGLGSSCGTVSIVVGANVTKI